MPNIIEITFTAMFFKKSGKFYTVEDVTASYEYNYEMESYRKHEAIRQALKKHRLHSEMTAVVTENVDFPIMVPAK